MFIDIESIEAGDNWLEMLKNFIAKCSVAVVVIDLGGSKMGNLGAGLITSQT